jgi:hypothetical protein
MAQRLPKQLCAGVQLAAAAGVLYTTPLNTITTISAATLTNSTATARLVTMYLVPAGGTPGAANMILSARTVAPGESYNVAQAIGQTIPAGATVQALCDAATAVTLVMSGYETNP